MKYQIFRIALGLILLMSTAEQAWAQLPPFFTICCAPDSSQLWVPVIDTATSSATYGRAVFRDSTYLATALGVGSAAAAGGIYAAANSGSNIGEGQQEVNIPDGDTLIFDLNSITGLGGRIRFQNTGDRYIEMFNPTTASWTWNAYNGVSQQGQFQMGANVILSAGNGVDITAQTSDILIETEDNLPIVISTYTDGGTYGTDMDLAQDPFARFDVTTQTIGGKILTIAQGSQRDNGVVIGEDFAKDTSNIVYAGQEGVRLGSEDGYWFEGMFSNIELPTIKDLDTIIAVNPTNGQWHLVDATSWDVSTNIYNADGSLSGNRTVTAGTNELTITGSGTGATYSTLEVLKTSNDALSTALIVNTVGTNQGISLKVSANNGQAMGQFLQSGSGVSLYASATSGFALQTANSNALTTSSQTALRHSVNTSGTAANGFGFDREVLMESSLGITHQAFREEVTWLDATDGAEDSQWEIFLSENGNVSPQRKLLLEGDDGALTLDGYTGTSNFGVETALLGTTATGQVVRIDLDSADIVGGGVNTNFAEDNLTTDGIRTHTIGHAVTFNQSTAGDITIQKDHGTSTELTFEISNQSTGDNIMYFNGVAESEDWSIGTDNSVDLFRIANSATLSGTPRFGINNVGAIRFDVYTTGGGVAGAEVGLLGHANNGTVTSIALGTDGQVLTMSGTDDFTWSTPSGSSLWTDLDATTYLTATGDNVNIGATIADEKLHVEVTTGDAYIKVQGGGVDATDEVGIKFFDGATADSKIEFEEVGTESIMRFSVEAETPLEIYEDAAAWSASDAYLNVDAGMVYGRVTQTSINLTLDEGHYCVYVTSGTVTITLPTTPDIGRQYFIINNSGNDCTIDPGVTSSTCATSGIDCINFVDASNYTLSTTESIIIMAIGTDGSGGWDWVTIE